VEACVWGLGEGTQCIVGMGIGCAIWYDGYLGALVLTKFDLRVCVIRTYAPFGEDHQRLEMAK
jgi:hypothetical protein